MKIQKLTIENRAKVYALLQRAFPGSDYEAGLVQKLHENGRPVHEWVCLHTNKVIAYLAFSHAYHGNDICGLHLAPMAVTPEFQKQGWARNCSDLPCGRRRSKARPCLSWANPAITNGLALNHAVCLSARLIKTMPIS
jgi:putative acetyltransferase